MKFKNIFMQETNMNISAALLKSRNLKIVVLKAFDTL